VRFQFRELPDPGSTLIRPRPIIDVVVEGLEIAPQACLLDGGATAVRFGMHVAQLCGLDLTGADHSQVAVGGGLVDAYLAETSLTVADEHEEYSWLAPAWFCEPWTAAFGLLGVTGFFDQFRITIAAYEEWLDLAPISR
jgi:hypothetical protein